MSLYKSVLETLHTDLCRLENAAITNILHGNSADSMDPKPIGKASSTQWIRVFVGAVSKWCAENVNAANAPESFLPEFNSFIKEVMEPKPVDLSDSTSDMED